MHKFYKIFLIIFPGILMNGMYQIPLTKKNLLSKSALLFVPQQSAKCTPFLVIIESDWEETKDAQLLYLHLLQPLHCMAPDPYAWFSEY